MSKLMIKCTKIFAMGAVYFLTTGNLYAICSNRLPGVCSTWYGSQSSCKMYYEDHKGKHYKCQWEDAYNQCKRGDQACSS